MKKKVIYNNLEWFILNFVGTIICSPICVFGAVICIIKMPHDFSNGWDFILMIMTSGLIGLTGVSGIIFPFLYIHGRFEKIIFDGECVQSKTLFKKISIPYNEIVEIVENQCDAVFSDHKIVYSITIKSADKEITIVVTKTWTADKIKQMLK